MEAIFEAFGINIQLLLAQLLNFGILAFLLTKFLFKPMFQVLNQRAEKAQEIETGAAEIQSARSDMKAWRKEQEREAKEQADNIIKAATEEAEARRASILEKANAEAEAVREKAQKAIALEREQVMAESRKQLASVALAAAEKVLDREVREADTRRLAEEAINAVQ